MWEVRRRKTSCTSLSQCKCKEKMGEVQWKAGEKAGWGTGTLGEGHGAGLPEHEHPSCLTCPLPSLPLSHQEHLAPVETPTAQMPTQQHGHRPCSLQHRLDLPVGCSNEAFETGNPRARMKGNQTENKSAAEPDHIRPHLLQEPRQGCYSPGGLGAFPDDTSTLLLVLLCISSTAQ